jgi:translation initiation factor IF-3
VWWLFLAKIVTGKGAVAFPQASINEDIRASWVRLVGSDGGAIGIVSIEDALVAARNEDLDLVLIAENSDPPVCKILDYGKYKFELQKKKTEAKKKQRIIDLKEVQVRPFIGENDLLVKCRAIKKFIEAGDKVKIVLRFRGRELQYQEIGVVVLTKIMDHCGEFCKEESAPKLEGSVMIVVLSAK